jgi:hypothetical protein
MEALVQRVRGEYREMPGLRLTFAQACRLWHMDAASCQAVLTRLVHDGILIQTRHGHYIAPPSPRAVPARLAPAQAAS